MQLITAVRAVLKYGCYNGHVKQLSNDGITIKSPDSEYHFSDFLPFLERTANGDDVFTLKNGVSHRKIFSGVVEL